MRQRILEALAFPRLQVLKSIDLRECPHDGVFESDSERCQHCDLDNGCHWLKCLGQPTGLEDKHTYSIHAALIYGLNLVEKDNESLQHDQQSCNCESCVWTRNAQQLIQEFKQEKLGDFQQLISGSPNTSA